MHGLDLPSLLTCGESHTATLEESCVRVIKEAAKKGTGWEVMGVEEVIRCYLC